ncbi:MAG: hypothetical protein GXP55_16865 [Deltaproteobacteria bacterium]|nr:hypothetical protein [Deltaproteobacteria bacterium]
MTRRLTLGLFVACLAWAPAAPSAAHLGHVVQRAERYLKLDLHPHSMRLVVSLTLGPGEMGRVLAAADANSDSTVSPEEANAYLLDWGRGLTRELPVKVDGEPVPVRYADAYFDPVGPVRSVAGTVEMVGHIELSAGEHRIEVSDQMRRQTFDRTDVSFQARDGVELLASGLAAPSSIERRLSYGSGESERQLELRARFPGVPRTWLVPATAGAGVLFSLLIIALGLRRRRLREAKRASDASRSASQD